MIDFDKALSIAVGFGAMPNPYGEDINTEVYYGALLSSIDVVKTNNPEVVGALAWDKTKKSFKIFVNPEKAWETFKDAITTKIDDEVDRFIDNARKFKGVKLERSVAEKMVIESRFVAILRAIIKHELLHFSLMHWARDLNAQDHQIANVAQDSLINMMIPEFDAFSLITVTAKEYAEILSKAIMGAASINKIHGIKGHGFRELYDPTWEQVFEKLKEIWPKVAGVGTGTGDGDSDSEEDSGGGRGDSGDISVGIGGSDPDYELVPTEDKDLAKEHAADIIEKALEESPKFRGTQAGRLIEEIIIQYKNRLEFDWRKLIRKITALGSKLQREGTWKRFSKRYGTPPGIKMRYKGGEIVVMLDTSGSVGDRELQEALSEVLTASKRFGLKVEGYYYDVEIQDKFTERDIKRKKVQVKGRGGTDLNNAFKQLLSQVKTKPTAVLIITDGYDDLPDEKLFTMPYGVLYTPDFNEEHKKRIKERGKPYAILRG